MTIQPKQKDFNIRRAQIRDITQLSQMLARAFDDDPVINWFLRQDHLRDQSCVNMFERFLLPMAIHRGEIYTSEDYRGAAIWYPPEKWKLSFFQELAALPVGIRLTGMRRFLSRMRCFHRLDALHPKSPHYYLETIGCDPDFQGKGYGSAVIQPVLNRCDDNGLPAYLENTKENNLHFYERFGFHITDTFTIPKNGPSIWLMWREPGKF